MCHRGAIYAAAVAAVPFLPESVGLPGKRREIFALVAGTPEGGADAAGGEEVVIPQALAPVEALVRVG
jgi:hypothetical protein